MNKLSSGTVKAVDSPAAITVSHNLVIEQKGQGQMNDMQQRIEEIDSRIDKLEQMKRVWQEQVGMEGSGMKASDIAFLNRQMVRLAKLKEKVHETLLAVDLAVDAHKEDW